MTPISGESLVAGVVGRPIKHSLSPLIHNAWLAASGVDGVYIAIGATEEGFVHLIEGLRGGSVRGLNVTLPFKQAALAAADQVTNRAAMAGAANLLLFAEDGGLLADNTDGMGLLGAFALQAPQFDPAASPVAILGAGGAARGAAAAFVAAGAPSVRLVNRTLGRAELIAQGLNQATGDDRVSVYGWHELNLALAGVGALVNATSLGLAGHDRLEIDLTDLSPRAAVMDMVYRPLHTVLLQDAARRGHPVVDGLAMLIGQAAPSFEAFYGRPPPMIDVRGLALAALESSS